MQNGPVSDTIRIRGGYRGIFMEEGVDTEHILGEFTDLEFENHKNVKKYKLGQIYVR